MGIFQKTGARGAALKGIELVHWIRLYGVKTGVALFKSFLTKKGQNFVVSAPVLAHPVRLRDNASDKAIFLQVYLEKQYELYGVTLPQATRIIDGGANVGVASVYFANKYPQASIVAIEPEENNFSLLVENTQHYKNIDCLKAGIWDKDEAIFIENPEAAAAGFMVNNATSVSGNSIKGMTIASIMQLKGWQGVDILKLDIEGAEKEVFSSPDQEWLSNIKLLIIEVHDFYKPGCAKAVFLALNKLEYDAYFHHENIFIFFK